MQLVHYFRKTQPHEFPHYLNENNDLTYIRGGTANKPANVFWLSMLDGRSNWSSFMQGELEADDELTQIWDLEQPMVFSTTSEAKLLTIESFDDVPSGALLRRDYRNTWGEEEPYTIIQWEKLREMGYSGAIVKGDANLQPEDKMRHINAHEWDVDSVVIWDPKAIQIS